MLHHACTIIRHGKLGAVTRIGEAHRGAKNVLLKIPCIDNVTNKELLERMSKEQELPNIIEARRLQYHGYVHRNKKIGGVLEYTSRGNKGQKMSRKKKAVMRCGFEKMVQMFLNRIVPQSSQ